MHDRNSYGRELPRAAAMILEGWMGNLSAGRLPIESSSDGNNKATNLTVNVDGEAMTVRAFLAACRQAEPEKVDAILFGLDRRETMIDPSKPYSVPDLTTPMQGAGLLNMLATRLRNGGPVPARVSAIGDRAGKGEPLRDALLAMRNDRSRDANSARDTLLLDEMPDGKVAEILCDRLERAGVLIRPPGSSALR